MFIIMILNARATEIQALIFYSKIFPKISMLGFIVLNLCFCPLPFKMLVYLKHMP